MTNTTISYIVVMSRPGNRRQGWLQAGNFRFRCALGRGGVSRNKREGDGATPAGVFALRRIWLRPDVRHLHLPRLPFRWTRKTDGWCDAPGHRRYNRPVPLPFAASHERLWREDAVYDTVIEIGWNDRPPIIGRGSAIFIHLARPGWTPTEGCVALAKNDMRKLLPLLGGRTRLLIR
ncbi:MAG: L,D-transpeptidase family protein [Methylocystis sp.]|nr:L,D-transpeptidase family protein [Methylocystis sp.]MCA3583289.1 L,D-transpeptidase family protein [Methylocystis sp.]MCA3588074.1 L,D-transpeptidase family protein [Methylocystis sp.]MCA3591484.1 L,D-transpeptidase family protein [Methylocystis sp.]